MARQPIFDRNDRIYAYELLFRDGTSNSFPDIDGDSASSTVLSNTFFSSDFRNITGGTKAFINFTRELLVKGIPLMFPPEITTVEILENVRIDNEVIDSCRLFSEKGYTLALDDFTYSPELDPVIEMTDIIKIDFRLTPINEIRMVLDRLSSKNIRFLAEKVETREEFNLAVDMGFSYFQGYYFSKPQVMSHTDIPTIKVNLLQIMTEATKDNYSIPGLVSLIERDVGVSYKLLRYLNSAFFHRAGGDISSIQHAIVMLGETGIRRFLSLIVLAELSEDKPDELLKSSIIRAKLMEESAKISTLRPGSSELFTLGIFSRIDTILEDSMENIMKTLPLSQEIKNTLQNKKTSLSRYLDLASAYEKGNWDEVMKISPSTGIDPSTLPGIYINALNWADSMFAETLV